MTRHPHRLHTDRAATHVRHGRPWDDIRNIARWVVFSFTLQRLEIFTRNFESARSFLRIPRHRWALFQTQRRAWPLSQELAIHLITPSVVLFQLGSERRRVSPVETSGVKRHDRNRTLPTGRRHFVPALFPGRVAPFTLSLVATRQIPRIRLKNRVKGGRRPRDGWPLPFLDLRGRNTNLPFHLLEVVQETLQPLMCKIRIRGQAFTKLFNGSKHSSLRVAFNVAESSAGNPSLLTPRLIAFGNPRGIRRCRPLTPTLRAPRVNAGNPSV